MVLSENKYLFNGKELQDEQLGGVNLDWYDYHTRQYDPALGRFITIDPHAENYLDWTPYNYVGNNPINLTDPDGMDWYRDNESGAVLWVDSQDKTYTKDGTSYSNIGATYSMEFGDGEYINYYQNAIVSYSKGGPVDALKTILGSDKAMRGFMGKNSPLSDEYKTDLLVASIHQTTDKWGEAAAMIMLGEMGGMVAGGAVEGLLALRYAKGAKLLKSASMLDKGGLSRVGRALQKHGSRSGSVFPKATGNPANMNAQGMQVLKSILNNPSARTTTRHHARFGKIMEIKTSSGQGARFTADGKTFIGFIE